MRLANEGGEAVVLFTTEPIRHEPDLLLAQIVSSPLQQLPSDGT